MKKIVSAALLFVAMLMCGSAMAAQPKAKDFIGEWTVTPETVAHILGEVPQGMGDGEFSCKFDFVSKKLADVYIGAKFQIPLEEGVDMVMIVSCELNCVWSYKKGVLNIEYYDVKAKLGELTLVPENPQFQMFMDMYRPTVEEEMSRLIIDSFNDVAIVESGEVTIVGNKMVIEDDGECLVLER